MDALSSPEILLFGPFRFDRRGRLLFRCAEDGRYLPVSIGSRALAVLEVLTERPGDLVSKDEIMGVAWPGLTVEEGNITVQISTLRRILDAGSEGESCIQTVSGRGYRFVRHVTRYEEEPVAAMSAPAADPAEIPVQHRMREATVHAQDRKPVGDAVVLVGQSPSVGQPYGSRHCSRAPDRAPRQLAGCRARIRPR